jgi:hypothetical protein
MLLRIQVFWGAVSCHLVHFIAVLKNYIALVFRYKRFEMYNLDSFTFLRSGSLYQ